MKIQGGCLCGKVRYSADTEPLRVVVCHCTNCQKQSGSAFSLVVMIHVEPLVLEGAVVDYIDRGDSGAEVLRRFCGSCGSPLISQASSRPDVAFIKAGTLDDISWLAPQAHIWRRSAQPWVRVEPDIPSFDGPFGAAAPR